MVLRLILFGFLHNFSAAAGDHFAGFDVQKLVTNITVHITILFCPYHRQQTFF